MVRKFMVVVCMMILMPSLASAGVIIPIVATGGSTGSISPAGTVYATTAKTYTLIAAANYTLDRIRNNSITVPADKISGSGPWTYVVPLSSSTQTVYVYFKPIPVAPPTVLIASAPSTISAALNTPQIISGGTSTISNLQPGTKAKFKWASNPATGAIFNPISSSVTSPGDIITSFTANLSGTYAATLTLSAPGATSSTANIVINVQPAGVAASNACLSCHAGWPQASAYATSKHGENASSSCQGCHDPTGAGAHPYDVNPGTVSAITFKTLTPNIVGLPEGAIFCTKCHTTGNIDSTFAGSKHNTTAGMACSSCHVDAHTAKFVTYSDCIACHTTATPQVVSDYLDSPHAAHSITCTNCHTEHGFATTVSICENCHTPHSWPSIGICDQCHNVHNPRDVKAGYPHFSSFSTAQYVTKNLTCNSCHFQAGSTAFKIYSANHQWANSGHGNPKSPAYIGAGPFTEANLQASDYKFLGTPLPAKPSTTTSQDCVRCHTTTGYINYVSSNFTDIHSWGTPGDRTREMVACPTCHTPTPFDISFNRRNVGIPDLYTGILNVTTWYGYSSAGTKKIFLAKTFNNPSDLPMGDSNICIACHSGKAVGDLIKTSTNCTNFPSIGCRVGETGTFWQNVDLIDPHGGAVANLMFDFVKAGFEFRSGSSFKTTGHTDIGTGGTLTQGPCVGCHMSSPKKHVFSPLSTASNGSIVAITTTVCSNCHGAAGPAFLIANAGVLETKKEGYQAALAVIAAQLAAKGIFYNAANPPYFFTSTDSAQQTFANRTLNWNYDATFQGAKLMGAAFNLRLLQAEAGAWAHNGTYAKRLLFDTIDYLHDGVMDGNVSSALQSIPLPMPPLIDPTTIDSDTKSKALAYIGITRP